MYPGANEVCDGVDNDYDSLVDSDDTDLDVTTYQTFYADTDGDTYELKPNRRL